MLEGPDTEGAYVPAAIWPDPSHDLTHLGNVAQRALVDSVPEETLRLKPEQVRAGGGTAAA